MRKTAAEPVPWEQVKLDLDLDLDLDLRLP
jgi:hypothetical protein